MQINLRIQTEQNLWQIHIQLFTVFCIKEFFPYSIVLNCRNFTSHGVLETLWNCSSFMTKWGKQMSSGLVYLIKHFLIVAL